MWKIDQILQLFAPFDCLACGAEGSLLCPRCRLSETAPSPLRCYRCLQASRAALCGHCVGQTVLDHVWAVSEYRDVSQQLISRLKFSRTQAAAHIVAQIMAERLPTLPPDTLIVHVPTANQRVRQRGYDQAQLIARELAGLRGLAYRPLLRRQGHSRQVGANRQERLRQLHQAYYCTKPEQLDGRAVLLVDDILTTGATIETAALVIKHAGAKQVSAALFAQKM